MLSLLKYFPLVAGLRSQAADATGTIVSVSHADYLALDSRLSNCVGRPLESGCLTAQNILTQNISAGQASVSTMLESVDKDLTSNQTSLVTPNGALTSMNTLVYGSTTSDSTSLTYNSDLVSSQVSSTVALISKNESSLNATLSGIAEYIDTSSSAIRTNLTSNLTAYQASAQSMIDTTASNQLENIAIKAAAMATAVDQRVTQVMSGNMATLDTGIDTSNAATLAITQKASESFSTLATSFTAVSSDVTSFENTAATKLSALDTELASAVAASVTAAGTAGTAAILATSAQYQQSIQQAALVLTNSLNAQSSVLAQKVSSVISSMTSNVSQANALLSAAAANSTAQIRSFQAVAGFAVQTLADAVNAGSARLGAMSGDPTNMANTFSALLKSAKSAAEQSIANTTAHLAETKSSLAAASANATAVFDKAFKSRLNLITDGIRRVDAYVSSSGDATSDKAQKLISGAQSTLSNVAHMQAQAVSDTSAAVTSGSALMQGVITSLSGNINQRVSDLVSTLSATLEDGENTVSDIGTAAQSQVSSMQSSATNKLESITTTLSNQVIDSTNQQTSLIAILNSLATNASTSRASDIGNVLDTLTQVQENLRGTQVGANYFSDQLAIMNATNQSNLDGLSLMQVRAEASAQTAADEAQQQLIAFVNQAAENLGSSIQQEAEKFITAFNTDLSAAASGNADDISYLQKQVVVQSDYSNSVNGTTEVSLALLNAATGPVSSAADSLVSLLGQIEQNEIADRTQSLSNMKASVESGLDSVKAALASAIGQQIATVQGSADALESSVKSKVANLQGILDQQDAAVTALETQAERTSGPVVEWASSFYKKLQAEQASMLSSTSSESDKIDLLNSKLSNWSSLFDSNYTAAEDGLQAGMDNLDELATSRIALTVNTLQQMAQEAIKPTTASLLELQTENDERVIDDELESVLGQVVALEASGDDK